MKKKNFISVISLLVTFFIVFTSCDVFKKAEITTYNKSGYRAEVTIEGVKQTIESGSSKKWTIHYDTMFASKDLRAYIKYPTLSTTTFTFDFTLSGGMVYKLELYGLSKSLEPQTTFEKVK